MEEPLFVSMVKKNIIVKSVEGLQYVSMVETNLNVKNLEEHLYFQHGNYKVKRFCKECGGSALCVHDRNKYYCKECKKIAWKFKSKCHLDFEIQNRLCTPLSLTSDEISRMLKKTGPPWLNKEHTLPRQIFFNSLYVPEQQ